MMHVLQYLLTDTVDIESISDLFAGYGCRIQVMPGGVLELHFSHRILPELKQDIHAKMRRLGTAPVRS